MMFPKCIYIYAYFLCKLVCVCIHESDTELTCNLYVFCLGVLTYNVMLLTFEHGYKYMFCSYVKCS